MKQVSKFYYYDMEKWFKDYAVVVYKFFERETEKIMYQFTLIQKVKKNYLEMFAIEKIHIKEEVDIRNIITNNIQDYIRVYEGK